MITRKLVIDSKGTLAPFDFKDVKINDRTVFIKEILFVDGKIPETQLQALTAFLMTDEVQDDLMDFPVEAVIVNHLHESAAEYRMRLFGTDCWIR